MSQINRAAHADAKQSVIQTLESRIEQLRIENCRLRGEVSVLEAGVALISQYEDQRLIDAARFRAILANNRNGIILLAPNGTVVEVVHSIFGYEKTQLVGRNCENIMRPESAQCFRNNLEYVVQTPGAERQAEYCIQNAAGDERWIDAILSDHLSHPAINAIVCNYRDLTDRKAAEAKHSLERPSPNRSIEPNSLGT